jgi:TPR repeat protein
MRYLVFTILLCIPTFAQAGAEDDCRSLYETKAAGTYAACLPLAQANEDGAEEFQRIVGDLYFFGWEKDSITQSYKDAYNWYKRAAGRNDRQSKYNLGVMLTNGWGVPQNPESATKYFRSAGKDGYAPAQLNLGNMYSKGEGIEQKDERAAEWYLRAAKQGDAVAQYNIGIRYAKGAGVPVDYVEAYKWVLLAHRAKVEEAKKTLEVLEAKIPGGDRAEGQKLANEWKPIIETPEPRKY